MIKNSQRGAALVIIFLIMTIVLVIVFGITKILFNEVRLIGSAGYSVSSFYAADSGIEKTLYFDRKQLGGGTRGLCNTCTACSATTNDCTSCTLTPLAGGGCNMVSCNNCRLDYTSTFNSKTYTISATVTPNAQNPSILDLKVISKGLYQGVMRQIELNLQSMAP